MSCGLYRESSSRLFFLKTVQRGENLLAVFGWFYASPHLDDLALGINQEGVAIGYLYAHVIAQGPVLHHDFLFLIAQKFEA
jgi:hypothetical protein